MTKFEMLSCFSKFQYSGPSYARARKVTGSSVQRQWRSGERATERRDTYRGRLDAADAGVRFDDNALVEAVGLRRHHQEATCARGADGFP